MKVTRDCYACLGNLTKQAAELATEDPDLRNQAIAQGMRLLEESFSLKKVSIEIATPLHRVIKRVTGNPDPYFEMKEAEIATARELLFNVKNNTHDSLIDDIHMAVRGNIIDFFKSTDDIKQDFLLPVEFAIDHTKELEERLRRCQRILYLADNTGEVFFDLNLLHRMENYADVTYVVKEVPVQNDVSLPDLVYLGLSSQLPRVISTGTDTPGVDMSQASQAFKDEFNSADMVIAKGMGYWETLSELPAMGKVFFLLKAKCVPVANSLDVPLNSYVALLR